jgi:dTDP-4-dehydrorhamnose 3,5-epimerase
MYNDFRVLRSKIFPDEVQIIIPDTFSDERGILFTDFLNDFFKNTFKPSLRFVHSKNAINNSKVLRGIHGDFKSFKLVQCLYGTIFQVVVDCREESETYLKHETFELNYKEPQMILIPPGFGNGFLVTSECAIYNYKLSYSGTYNDHERQFTYKWNDPRIGIHWPIKNPVLSKRDE